MIRHLALALAILPKLAMGAETGLADPLLINGNITCGHLLELVDGGNGHSVGIATQFMADVFYDADQPFVLKKRGGIAARLSEEGLVKLIALGFLQCRDHSETQARLVMLDVYAGIRGMDRSLGLVK